MLNVLLVEDDLTIADLLQEALEIAGHHVTGIARTVKEAVQLAEQHRADVAVVDIRLANGDSGTDVATYLRRTSSTRVMFSTGNGNERAAMAECGDAVMTKPYRLSDVAQGLTIIDEMARSGQTKTQFPKNFRLLTPAVC